MSGLNANESSSAAATACAPCGLWAASSTIVGLRRITSSRPGEVTSREGAADQLLVERRGRPTKASTAASATAAFCAWWAPYSGRNTSSYPARAGPAATASGRRPRAPGTRRRTRRPRAATVAPTSAARSRQHRGDLGRLLGEHGDRAGLDDPGLLDRDARPASSPRYCAWSTAIGRTTATVASATFVASQVPPMPTSTTAASTGASAKAAYAIADDRSRRTTAGAACACVDEVRVRRDVVEGAHELPRRSSGSPSMLIRSLIRSTCGLVKRPVRRSERAQQRVDHPRRSRSCRWCRSGGSPGTTRCGSPSSSVNASIRSSDGSSLVSGQRDSSASSASAKVWAGRGRGVSVMAMPECSGTSLRGRVPRRRDRRRIEPDVGWPA